eukprot:scaffold89577_cov72-Phaeocystis_antarctica.AAC.2
MPPDLVPDEGRAGGSGADLLSLCRGRGHVDSWGGDENRVERDTRTRALPQTAYTRAGAPVRAKGKA